MPLPLGPVPLPLANFFRSGGINQLVTAFNRTGGGLQFYNVLRKMFPKPPSVPQWFYQELISYLSQFTTEFRKSTGLTLNLDPNQKINFDLSPRNIFLRSIDPVNDRYLVRFEYNLTSSDGRKLNHIIDDTWFNEMMTTNELYEDIKARIRNKIALLNAASKTGDRYELAEDSLTIVGIARRY